MLKTEFDERLGRTSTGEEYEVANLVYLDVNIDKDQFVKEWKEIENVLLVKALIRNLGIWEKSFHEERKKRLKLVEVILDEKRIAVEQIETIEKQRFLAFEQLNLLNESTKK